MQPCPCFVYQCQDNVKLYKQAIFDENIPCGSIIMLGEALSPFCIPAAGHLVGSQFHEKKNFSWQNGVEAGIHAKYVLTCVVKQIGVDAKSENVPKSHLILGQLCFAFWGHNVQFGTNEKLAWGAG